MKEEKKMKKFTVVIKNEKIERHENQLAAIFSAWEQKMKGKQVKVVDDETCKTIYK
jgi:hypothetical protein